MSGCSGNPSPGKDPWQLQNRCYDPAFRDRKKDLMDKLGNWMNETGDPDRIWYHRIKEYY